MQPPSNSAAAPKTKNNNPVLWSEKYRPTSIATMCSPGFANRLKHWLTNWENCKPNGPPADTTSALKRAALLSGSPGVGKTTTVYAVAREKGYEVIEFNASDQRSAKSLRESVGDLVSNRVFKQSEKKNPTFGSFFNMKNRIQQQQEDAAKTASGDHQHYSLAKQGNFILLMDEVDGLDRGGAGEIIQLIKNSKMPIICTCNDRWHQKLRSLVNYCEDIRFSRPAPEMVFNYLKTSVLPHEQVSVPERIIKDFIAQTGGDIRCVLNNLQLWSTTGKHMTEAQLVKPADSARKNIDLGLFDAAEKFFAANATDSTTTAPMTIDARLQLFYNSDLIDLFVHENYLHYKPDRRDWLKSAAAAANSIAVADVLGKQIFAEQTWGMGSAAAYRGAIYPTALCKGQYQTFLTGPSAAYDRRSVKFPSWLGHNSTSGKNKRIATIMVKQGQDPAKGYGVGSAHQFVMDYVPTLQPKLVQPVAEKGKEGISEAIKLMDQYHIQRDDWDYLQELVEFKKQVRVNAVTGRLQAMTHQVQGPVKAALTREFNKTNHVDRAAALKGVAKTVSATSMMVGNSSSSKKEGAGDDDDNNSGDDDDDDNEGGGKKGGSKKKPAASAAGKKAAPKKASSTTAKAPSAKKASAKKPAGKGDADTTNNTNGVRRQRQDDEIELL